MRPPGVPTLRKSPACIDAARSTREPLKAGKIPEAVPTNTADRAATIRNLASTWISSKRGKSVGASAGTAAVNTHPIRIPSVPPSIAITRLSVNSCRTSLARAAPRAERTASSRPRSQPRDRKRLATFAHAINSTSITAAASTSSAGRTRIVI